MAPLPTVVLILWAEIERADRQVQLCLAVLHVCYKYSEMFSNANYITLRPTMRIWFLYTCNVHAQKWDTYLPPEACDLAF